MAKQSFKAAIELAMKIKAADPSLTRRQALARAMHLQAQTAQPQQDLSGLFVFFQLAANTLSPGEKLTLTNGKMSFTVRREKSGQCSVKGNNAFSRKLLENS